MLALDLEVDAVAVTVMTNLGFHALMGERGIRVLTTDVGDRYVLEALQRGRDPRRRAVGSHHLSARSRHRRRARRRTAALRRAQGPPPERGRGRDAALAAGQGKRPGRRAGADSGIVSEVERLNGEWDGKGRILVRPSGTEPLVRVLAEAEDAEVAAEACASIAALVRRELG